MSDIENSYMGMGSFVWWFGVVESRDDPLHLGRCKIRFFGAHSANKNEIATEDLEWAHPVVPFGSNTVKPPAEGEHVFGFMADGKNGKFPILLGTVPGIPEEFEESNTGFSDPYTEEQKAEAGFPRAVANSRITTNASGPNVTTKTPARYPTKHLNEPTTHRLARPSRADEGESYLGIRASSIEETPISFQRKNRVSGIKTSNGTFWNEPFPSYNAKYPYNYVIYGESGHTIEIDDTAGFERVQISHRTGSTMEFLPTGSVKQKTFNHKYDVTMGNSKEYVNGDKSETVQGDSYIRVNGKLVIEADSIEFISTSDLKLKGKNINATSLQDINLHADNNIRGTAIKQMDLRGETKFGAFGGLGGAALSSSTRAVVQATESVKISAATVFTVGLTSMIDTVITNVLPPVVVLPNSPEAAQPASRYNRAVANNLVKTTSSNRKEFTDVFANANTSVALTSG